MATRLSMKTILAALCAATLAGCGGGDERRSLSGTVTFNGQPVVFGEVVFRPEKGPEGSATIREGKFDTALESGRGVIPGPNRMFVTGYESEPISIGDETADVGLSLPIFINYEMKADISGSTYDIVVPSDASITVPQ
jgi:hypothetical protein